MIAAFVIESVLFIYTLVRFRMNTAGRLTAALLACLAVFQVAEYHVCEYSGTWSAMTGSRVGYVAIT